MSQGGYVYDEEHNRRKRESLMIFGIPCVITSKYRGTAIPWLYSLEPWLCFEGRPSPYKAFDPCRVEPFSSSEALGLVQSHVVALSARPFTPFLLLLLLLLLLTMSILS